MKKSTPALTIVALLLAFCAFAKDDHSKDYSKLTADYAIKTYILAFTQGQVKPLPDILDPNVRFTITQGEKILNFSRSEMLEMVKASENIQQNCTAGYSLIEQNTSQAIYKVILKYESFSKVNYITVAQTKKGWKLTNVSTVFN